MAQRVADPPVRTRERDPSREARSDEFIEAAEDDFREGVSLLRQAIEALPPQERVVLVMHDMAGFSHAEISKRFRISSAASRSGLVRARRRLQQVMAASSGGSLTDEPEPASVETSDIRLIFLRRVWSYVRRVASQAPEAVLMRALQAETAEGTVAAAMSGLVVEENDFSEDDRVLSAAIAEGARQKTALLAAVGGGYTAEQLASLLKITPQAVHGGRQTNLYFGVPVARGYRFPKFQLTPSGLLGGLKEFLSAFSLPDPWTKFAVLVSPTPRLGGRSPLDALKAGELEEAVDVAASYGSHGA